MATKSGPIARGKPPPSLSLSVLLATFERPQLTKSQKVTAVLQAIASASTASYRITKQNMAARPAAQVISYYGPRPTDEQTRRIPRMNERRPVRDSASQDDMTNVIHRQVAECAEKPLGAFSPRPRHMPPTAADGISDHAAAARHHASYSRRHSLAGAMSVLGHSSLQFDNSFISSITTLFLAVTQTELHHRSAKGTFLISPLSSSFTSLIINYSPFDRPTLHCKELKIISKKSYSFSSTLRVTGTSIAQ